MRNNHDVSIYHRGSASQRRRRVCAGSDCSGHKSSGLTFLEVILAITLLAIVLGGGLILIGHNMIIIKNAEETMVATALTQYAIQDARNMDFPPVYYDRLANELSNEFLPNPPYTDEFVSSPPADKASAILAGGRNITPLKFQNDYSVIRYIIAYGSNGVPLNLTSLGPTNYENYAMELEIIVYVIQKPENNIVSQDVTYMSRNGAF
jgi:type II secretory pathway pseudopilin PulG